MTNEFVVGGLIYWWDSGMCPDSVSFLINALLQIGCKKVRKVKHQRHLYFGETVVGYVLYGLCAHEPAWAELHIDKDFAIKHRKTLVEHAAMPWASAIVDFQLDCSGAEDQRWYRPAQADKCAIMLMEQLS